MKYTIEQINEAWIKYNQPKWIFSSKDDGQEIRPVNLPKVDFVSYLISYFSKAISVSKVTKKKNRT